VRIQRRKFLLSGGAALCGLALPSAACAQAGDAVDVCVYGGTASGVMAAVAAAREGCRVLLVEPSRWLGGMTGGGLCHIDWGRKAAVGGTARGILSQGYNDPQYRHAFLDLVKQHAVTVLYEYRLGAVRREETSIRGLVLDHAPPDRYGCPSKSPTTTTRGPLNCIGAALSVTSR
jgi:NADPH-dependent 2,4-dienoyl-CoA reductase/sulfur reductase-like enzyme